MNSKHMTKEFSVKTGQGNSLLKLDQPALAEADSVPKHSINVVVLAVSLNSHAAASCKRTKKSILSVHSPIHSSVNED